MNAHRRSVASVLLVLSTSALSAACAADAPPPSAGTQAAAKSGLADRDPALAHRLVAAGAVLLDVRSPEEFADRHIEGAVNISVDELGARTKDIEKLTGGDKQKPIVVYCAAGARAGRAKKMLVGAGYDQVTNLGGISDWDRK